MKLTATKVEKAKARTKVKDKAKSNDYKLSDGHGLFLLVKENGSKYWRLSYRYQGKQKTMALGVYPSISLSQAREKTSEARKLLATGEDPGQIKKIRKAGQIEDSQNTFRSVSLEWFEVKMHNMSDGHKKRVLRALEIHLFPYLGNFEIRKVGVSDLLVPLRKIESQGKLETAHRAKQTASQVLRYAVATGRAGRDFTVDLKGAIKSPKEKNRAAITDPKELGMLLNAMDNYDGGLVVKTALIMTPHLFLRPGELRHLEWEEINWERKRIEIPSSKMKMREPLIIPLSNQTYTMLDKYKEEAGQRGKYVFPSARGASRPLSNNGIRTALRAMGYDNETVSVHGFRATARTLLDEVLGYRIDYIEHQLAHAVKDANGRAYNRTTHLEGRTKMMHDWSDYLDSLKQEQNKKVENHA